MYSLPEYSADFGTHFFKLEHTDGRLTNSNLFRTCQPILTDIYNGGLWEKNIFGSINK